MCIQYVVKHNLVVFDDILHIHYILIYSTHNGDDAPQNIVPRCRSPDPNLLQHQDTVPYSVKKSQSYAPEDGLKVARNMLN